VTQRRGLDRDQANRPRSDHSGFVKPAQAQPWRVRGAVVWEERSLCRRSMSDQVRVVPAVWIAAALVPMIASQIIRLHQREVASWIAFDYAGRLVALAVLAVIPAARAVAFRRDKRQVSVVEIALWTVGASLVERLSQWPRSALNAALPATVFGTTSLVFGCYHWWAGLGNVLMAMMIGILFMLMLRRSVALWPVVFAHYLVDLIAFA
jgi:CAAX protease family protein